MSKLISRLTDDSTRFLHNQYRNILPNKRILSIQFIPWPLEVVSATKKLKRISGTNAPLCRMKEECNNNTHTHSSYYIQNTAVNKDENQINNGTSDLF